jgi:autotransporter-associated beta strand protein
VVASGAKLAVNHSDGVSQAASGGLGDGTAIISGAGGFAQIGNGTTTLTLANTYTGTTTINAGTLLVNNTTGSGTGGGNVSVTTGTLGGNGSITGTVTIGDGTGSSDAILAPGNSIDSIDTGNLAFNGDGSYAVELNGTSATTDVANVTGTVTIHAATTLTVSVAGMLSASQQYIIVSNDAADAVIGTFAGLTQDALVGTFGGTALKISYTGGDGNDIVLYTTASGSPYSSWAGSAVFTDDANGDGVRNGLAWILGASGPGVSAIDKLPVVATPAGFLTLDFDRVTAHSPAKLYVEYGNDLVGWTKVEIPAASGTFGGDLEVVVTSGTLDQLLVKIPTIHAFGGKLFARLSTTEN